MSVELRHLRALVAVADSASFTDPAARLGVTQPTLSRTIAQLEENVGRRLVERTTRRTSLTDEGRFLVVEARTALKRLDRSLSTLTSPRPGKLRIGWTWAAFGDQTTPLLRAWREASSAPTGFDGGFEVEIVRASEPFGALDAGDIDAAVTRKALPAEIDYDRYQSAHLYTEHLVAAISHEDPLAEQLDVRLADLAARQVAFCATTPTATPALWGASDKTPAAVEVEGTDEWLATIVLRDAVGVTAEATSYNYPHPEIRYVPIKDSPTVEVLLVWPLEGTHANADVFARFARNHFRNLAATRAARTA